MTTAHASPTTAPASRRSSAISIAVLRLVGAALLGTNAGIHAYLWDAGYRTIADIGPLFLLDVIAASALTLAVLGAPRRLLPLVSAAGALLEGGTVAGLFVTTKHELFGFIESTRATLYWESAYTEIAGAVVLATLAAAAYRRTHTGAATSRW